MKSIVTGPLHRRLLAILSLLLFLSAVLAGSTGKAAPTAQATTPNPTPTKPILLTDSVPDPHQDGVMYFPQTGHTLRSKFLQYWQQYGGLAQFGYPLTEEFFEPSGLNNAPLQVQYFERNRFELHPENTGTPYEVLLGTLSREFRSQDPPASQQPAPALYFTETGHNLSGKFLEYWQSHGGLSVHGYPITEAVMEQSTNGKVYLVQWFERSRFELHPENAGSPYEVLLGVLGRQLSEKRGYPFGWYPASGYAVDYSWLTGYVDLYGPSTCSAPWCGCTRFRYGTADMRVQLNHPIGIQYPFSRDEIGRDFTFVAFGRSAQPKENAYVCPSDIEAPVYFVYLLKGNPVK